MLAVGGIMVRVNVVEVQLARLRRLDPRLTGATMTHLGGGASSLRGGGVELAWNLTRLADDDPARVYAPAVSANLALLGGVEDANADAVVALLERWAAEAAPDAVLQATWPNADELVADCLRRAGFEARSVFALRPPGVLSRDGPLIVRRATPADLDAVFALHEEESAFHRRLDPTMPIVDAERKATYDRLAAGLAGEGSSLVHVVEVGGHPAAMCESWLVEVAATGATGGHTAGQKLPPGAYAYVNTVCVTARHRGRGLGRALMDGVHADLAETAVDGTFLWYESRNPISPGFWQTMGYRPLWTVHRRPPAAP